MLHLGLFKQFKGEDTLLLSGTPGDIADLSARLEEFSASGASDLAIHSFAALSPDKPTELFACRTPQTRQPSFVWLCVPDSLAATQSMLQAMSCSVVAHQYFDLYRSSVPLLVSVGEYSDSWWSGAGPNNSFKPKPLRGSA